MLETLCGSVTEIKFSVLGLKSEVLALRSQVDKQSVDTKQQLQITTEEVKSEALHLKEELSSDFKAVTDLQQDLQREQEKEKLAREARINNLRIVGLPEKDKENTKDVVLKFFQEELLVREPIVESAVRIGRAYSSVGIGKDPMFSISKLVSSLCHKGDVWIAGDFNGRSGTFQSSTLIEEGGLNWRECEEAEWVRASEDEGKNGLSDSFENFVSACGLTILNGTCKFPDTQVLDSRNNMDKGGGVLTLTNPNEERMNNIFGPAYEMIFCHATCHR
ncbi:hypothetical protein R1sor_024063 [Riccia sorocarpa]|uniref:Endonuclease/exonuclease/phosphatase domain-containing protein n=1 Tax=Riccia sorocarpa TaxID=122646 RepID=A0ABD3GPG4_9MARC